MSTPPTGIPFATARDTVAQFLSQSDELRALGLPEDAVYQADTAESPSQKPFIVIRWGDTETKMHTSWVDPVDLWVYDDFGDYTRATKIAKAAARILVENVVDIKTSDGRISQMGDRGIAAHSPLCRAELARLLMLLLL